MTAHRRVPKMPGPKVATRADVLARDGGKCAVCGVVDPKWEFDHEKELWTVDRTAEGAREAWSLSNAVTLCREHHRTKTALQTKQRAKEARIRKKIDGTAKPKRKIPSRPWPKRQESFQRRG